MLFRSSPVYCATFLSCIEPLVLEIEAICDEACAESAVRRILAIMRDGALIQVGTPEELISNPADEYVANFIREFPRSHVITLRKIAREPIPTDDLSGPELPPTLTVRDAARTVLEAGKVIRVVESGKFLGVVGKTEVLSVIAGAH